MLQLASCPPRDCISIGDDTSIGADTQLPGLRIENGYLIIGRVDIGSRCFIGSHSALGLDVRMGDDSRLDDQSLLPDGEAIPEGEFRRGSPARKATVAAPSGPPRRLSNTRLTLFCIAQVLTAFVLGLVLGLPAIGLALGMGFTIVHASPRVWVPVLIAAPPLLIVFSCFYVAFCKKLIQPRPTPGVYNVYSFKYLQFWLTSGLMRAVRGAGMLIFTPSTCRPGCASWAPGSASTPRCRQCGASTPTCWRPTTACSSPTAASWAAAARTSAASP
jgi:hypothetical protein